MQVSLPYRLQFFLSNCTGIYIILKFDLPASCRLQPFPLDSDYCLKRKKTHIKKIKPMHIDCICDRSRKVCVNSYCIYKS